MKKQVNAALVSLLIAFPTLALLPEENLKKDYGLDIPDSKNELRENGMYMVVGILKSPSFEPDEYWQLGIGKNISKNKISKYDNTQLRIIHRKGTANPMFIWQACYSATKIDEHVRICDSLQGSHADTTFYTTGTISIPKDISKIVAKIDPGIKDKPMIDGTGYFIDYAVAHEYEGLKYSMQAHASNQEKGDPIFRILKIIESIR